MAFAVEMRAEERTTVYSSFFALLGMTAAHTLVETARDALFLAKVPASRLVWVYAMFAVIAIVIARVGGRGDGAVKRGRVAPGLVVGAGVTLCFWIAMTASHSTSLVMLYALYLWPGVFGALIIGQLWSVIGGVLTVAQAKRLFAFIGAGAVLGALFGAALSRVLTSLFAPEHLLLGGALLFLATGLLPARMLDHVTGSVPIATHPRRPESIAPPASFSGDLRTLLADPYQKRVLLLVFLSTLALTAGDFLFKSTVAAHVPPARLASFFATVSIALNALALITQLVGVRILLRSLGVNRALAIMPFLLLAGAIGVAFVPFLLAALFVRGVDGTLRHSLHRTTSELLFVPISSGPAKSLVDLLGQRGAQLASSLALLPLFALGGERALGVAVAVISAAWLGVALRLKKPYLDLFRKTLREGRIDDAGALPQLDLSALETLFAALNSEKDPEVLGALDLLAAQERGRLVPALVLYHPSKPIVLRALELLTADKRRDFVPIADRLIAQHPDAEVRAACLRARTEVAPDHALLRKLLDTEEEGTEEVRATALAALVAHGFLTGEEAQREIATLTSGSRGVRSALARATAFDPSREFEDALVMLAADVDPSVRVEATRALGRRASPRFIPLLVAMLDGRREAAAAREALAEIGAPALVALDGVLGDHFAPRDLRWGVARALGHWRDAESAAAVLVKNLPRAKGDGMLQTRMARALNRLRRAEPSLAIDDASITRECRAAISGAFDDLAHRLAIEEQVPEGHVLRTPTFELLISMLRDEEANAIAHVCSLLGLLHPSESFARIERGLRSRSAKTRASSRELIEHVVAAPLRAAMLTLVDDAPDSVRLSRAGAFGKKISVDLVTAVRTLVARKGEVHVVAAYYATEAGLFEVDKPEPSAAEFDMQLGAALAARANEQVASRRGADV